MQARSLRRCLLLTFVAVAVPMAAGRTEPLPKEACDAVLAEHAKLSEAGLPDLVEKGPDWVKANQGEGRMQEVARYIRLREDLLFKCGHDKLKDDPAADTGPPLPQRKPAVPADYKSRAIPAAAHAAEDKPGASRSTPRPKPRQKPKVDDAYRPPPKPARP